MLDSIIAIHENIHSLVDSKKKGFLTKLDLSKAYDRVEWSFLGKVLGAFGFGVRFIKLIDQLISTPSFSVIVNGVPSNFFKTSRGIRQEDHISPILFIILDECLGRFINNSISLGFLCSISPSFGFRACTHEQFIDNTILM